MESNGGFVLSTTSKPSRKRRSNLNRRPPNESESPQEYHDSISLSSTPSEHISDAPSEGNVDGLNSNQCISRASYTNLADAETEQKSYDEDGVLEDSKDFKKSTEDNPAAVGTGNKFNKVKLKVGGVTHTIHTKSSSDGSSLAGTSALKSTPSDTICPTDCLSQKENYNLPSTGEKSGLRGVPWKDFSKTGFSFGKEDSLSVDIPEESVKQDLKHRRPSRRLVKKYSSEEIYHDEDDYYDDDEIRYLQKLKSSQGMSYDNTEYEDQTRGKKLRKISKVMDTNIDEHAFGVGDYESSRSVNLKKKSRPVRASEDTDYMELEESVSDGDIEHKNKKQRKELIDVSEYSNKESSITTRRRAILTGRDVSPGLIQFPDGLPPAPSRKQKEQLTEVEQQLKRAEAAERRRIQNEKAARESEAEAIRKILGQDSSRKRREERNKKRMEELAQERSANAATVAPDSVRWVMGPSGTVVTFPDELGLPSIFEPKPCSYPPPREKCAGPSCTNEYKYRDSKSKLPLCSLQCYKAIHDNTQIQPAC